MFIRIDQALPDPLYRQIRDEIVRGIAQGELAPGDAVLVKASHFMGLTRVVEGLVK